MKLNVRAMAAISVHRIIDQGDSLNIAIQHDKKPNDIRDQALLRELVYGVCRNYHQLLYLSKQLLTKPIKKQEHIVNCIIYVGLYQLLHCRVPPHAAVAETVAAAKQLHKLWASGLVNAVLRNFQRRTEQLMMMSNNDEVARFMHPSWLIKKIRHAWPEEAENIFAVNNSRPPLTLRVNRRNVSRDEYLDICAQQNIEATSDPYLSYAITLKEQVGVDVLPQFWEGACFVQDAASQGIEAFLNLAPKQSVLDACAAPGGKTTLLLEIEPDIDLLAVDNSADRVAKIHENLSRLKLKANVVEGDCLQPETWIGNKKFDQILLDVPCSATGVIRRHPDIKLRRCESDIIALKETQLALLKALWPYLNNGGRLLYTTCSILPEENEKVIQCFLSDCGDAIEIPLTAPWGLTREHGLQVLPGQHDRDGFYYALLERRS